MAYDVPKFLKRKDDALLFNNPDGELVFYVPEYYFKSRIAEIYGAYYSFIGICNYSIFDKNGNNNGLHEFNFPTIFMCKPYEVEKISNVKLTKNVDPSDYRLLKFKYGDEVVTSVKVPQIIDNVEILFKAFLISGKIPTTIPYDKLHEYFKENINLNGSDYGINMQLFGIIVSEICRDPKDLSKPFRLSNNDNMNDYRPISIKTVPNYVSPFVSFTSENFDESLIASITMDSDKYSPLEKILIR